MVKSEEFVIFFRLSNLLWMSCWGGLGWGQLGEQIKQELGRLDLGDSR